MFFRRQYCLVFFKYCWHLEMGGHQLGVSGDVNASGGVNEEIVCAVVLHRWDGVPTVNLMQYQYPRYASGCHLKD